MNIETKMNNFMRYRLTEPQLLIADAICDEFGPRFQGIRDRVDSVRWAITTKDVRHLEDASEELLMSVNGVLARRIAPDWKEN